MIDEGDLWNKAFVNAAGQRFRPDIWKIMGHLQVKHEAFSMVVFLCGIVTIMLLGFIGYHTWLINKGFTTNEQVRNMKILNFVESKVTFMAKWAKAREDKKAFKPTQKTIAKYEVDGDIRTDLTDAEVNELKDKVDK